MKFTVLPVLSLFATWASTAGAIVVPGASTPVFYLVSTSTSDPSSLLPLRVSGGSTGFSSLSGSGAIAKFYFYQGKLVVENPSSSDPTTNTLVPYINTVNTGSQCATYGPLAIGGAGSTNKCASYSSFQIQSDSENSQLGAQLVFNYVGGFYACGVTKDVWYKTAPTQDPSGCDPIDLFTVPVAPV